MLFYPPPPPHQQWLRCTGFEGLQAFSKDFNGFSEDFQGFSKGFQGCSEDFVFQGFSQDFQRLSEEIQRFQDLQGLIIQNITPSRYRGVYAKELAVFWL